MVKFLLKVYSTSALAPVCDLLLAYYLFKRLTVEDVGIYSELSAYLVLALVLLDGQLSVLLVRICGGKGERFLLGLKSVVGQRVNAIALGVLVIFAGALIHSGYISLYLMIAGIALLTVADSTLVTYFRVKLSNSVANFFVGLNGLLRLIGALTFTVFFELNILSFTIGILIAKIVYFTIVCCVVIPKVRKEKKSSETRLSLLEGIEQGSYMTASALSAAENRLDWFIIGALLGPKQLATYVLGNKVFEVSKMVVGIGMTNVFPHLSHNNEARGFYVGMFSIVMVMAVAVSLVANTIESHFGTEKYFGAAGVIVLFMLVSPLSALVGFIYQQAMLINRYRAFLYSSALAVMLQAVINYVFIPVYGIFVAPLSMGTSWALIIFGAFFYIPNINKPACLCVIGISALLSTYCIRSM